MELACQHGATAIGISNCLNHRYIGQANSSFARRSPKAGSVAALSPLVTQICLIDAIYLLVARQKKNALTNAERMNTHTEDCSGSR